MKYFKLKILWCKAASSHIELTLWTHRPLFWHNTSVHRRGPWNLGPVIFPSMGTWNYRHLLTPPVHGVQVRCGGISANAGPDAPWWIATVSPALGVGCHIFPPLPHIISSLFRSRPESLDVSCDSCSSCFCWRSYYLHIGRAGSFWFNLLTHMIEKIKDVWGGLTNSWEKKTNERPRRKGMIYPSDNRVSKKRKER